MVPCRLQLLSNVHSICTVRLVYLHATWNGKVVEHEYSAQKRWVVKASPDEYRYLGSMGAAQQAR